MAYITCWLPLFLVIFTLTNTDVASEKSGELIGGTVRDSKLCKTKELLQDIINVSAYYINHMTSI